MSTSTTSISSTAGGWSSDQLDALVTVATASAISNVDNMEREQTRLNARDSDISAIRDSLDTLQDKLEDLVENGAMASKKTQLTEEDVMDVDADPDAVTGNYEIEVTALAQRHRLASSSFSDSGTALSSAEGAGTKTFTITCGEDTETFSVDVAAGETDEDLMEKICDKINSNSSLCSAGIIKEGSDSSTLIFESKSFGVSGSLTFADTSGTLLKSAGVITGAGAVARQLQAGTDASLKIGNTLTITRPSNEISDAINGVSLNLKTLGTTTLTVSVDTDTVMEKFKEFVSAYNSAQTLIGTEVNETPDTPEDGETESDVDVSIGTLYANSQMRGIRNALRRILTGTRDLTVRNMAELGITSVSSEKEGSSEKACNIELDSTTLKKALKENPEAVKELLIGSNGILTALNTELSADLKYSTGTISNLEDANDQRLEAASRRIKAAKKLLEQQTAYYENLYNSFSSQITSMQATSQTLSAVLASLGTTSST